MEIEVKCRHCGKDITLLDPRQWGYRKKDKKGGWVYYCTWKCLRADEKQNERPEHIPQKREYRERLKVLEDMIDAAGKGRNVYDYLREQGYKEPKDTLRRLRLAAKKDAPEIYQKMVRMGLMDLRTGHSGKGVEKMSQNKLTREQKGKAVEIAIQGGDYLEYLKKCGAKNPSAAWWYIKKTLAQSNPKLLEQIPEKSGTVLDENGLAVPLAEVAEKLPPEAVAEVPKGDPLAGFQVVNMDKPAAKVTELEKTDDGVRFVISVPPEQAEQMDKVFKDMMDPERDALCMSLYNPPKENRIRYTVMSIKTKAGTFSINEETEKISWSGGASCTVMHKEDWENLAEVLPEVLEILGEVNC